MLSLHASNKLEDGCRRPGHPSQLRSPSLLATRPFAAPGDSEGWSVLRSPSERAREAHWGLKAQRSLGDKAKPKGKVFPIPDAESLELSPSYVWACTMLPVLCDSPVFVFSCQELQNPLQQRLLLRPAGVLLEAEEKGVQ